MSKHKDWFDEHVIIDFGDFNNKEDKKKAVQQAKRGQSAAEMPVGAKKKKMMIGKK